MACALRRYGVTDSGYITFFRCRDIRSNFSEILHFQSVINEQCTTYIQC
ncbi:MAG: hypothetical protein P8X74_01740 [Reinekea sp.]